jgi:biotin-dependent carboxylase-like uncharacterized protein
MESLKIIHPGLLTTIQDLGRIGYQKYGIPKSGALDNLSLRIGNLLVGNHESAAGLEITLIGPTIKVLKDEFIAITGANLNPCLNQEKIPMWESIFVKKGNEISFKEAICGVRSYLCVAGGIDVPVILNSRSTFIKGKIGGKEGRPLKEGDILKYGSQSEFIPTEGARCPDDFIPKFCETECVRVIMGPQDYFFDKKVGINTFLSSEYTVTVKNDRMGYRLNGPVIRHAEKKPISILSEGIIPGAIQIPGNGQPIVLLKEQTVGGYAKIATVISVDIRKIAQMRAEDKLRFKNISIKKAHKLLNRQETQIKEFKNILFPNIKDGF